MNTKLILLTLMILSQIACKDNTIPKPESLIRLDYPKANYKDIDIETIAYQFQYNQSLSTKYKIKSQDIQINYPKMKATIYLTHKEINNNLNKLLIDAQKLTFEHAIKADEIFEQNIINQKDKVFGMYYQVGGNAATNAQFYLTDSITHFLTGSIYFYAKPNYDSIYPAIEYLKRDLKHLINTFKWKNQESIR